MSLFRKTKPVSRHAGRQRLRQTTDWQAPSAFSYRAQRSERSDNPSRQAPSLAEQRHRLLSVRYWARRSGLLVAVIVGIVCLISILSISNNPRIVLLDDGNNSYAFHPTNTYQQAAAQYLGHSIWNRNKITVNTGAASAALQQQYPELANVAVTLPLIGHRPIYYLRATQPAFVVQAVNGTYVLDTNGKVLIAAASVPQTVVAKLPVVADQTGLHAEVGKSVMSSQNALFVRTVMATLGARNVQIAGLLLPANAVQELDVRVAGKPYLIKFNMHDNDHARQQAGTYLATINNLSSQGISPSQYVDVRLPGRAYYQ